MLAGSFCNMTTGAGTSSPSVGMNKHGAYSNWMLSFSSPAGGIGPPYSLLRKNFSKSKVKLDYFTWARGTHLWLTERAARSGLFSGRNNDSPTGPILQNIVPYIPYTHFTTSALPFSYGEEHIVVKLNTTAILASLIILPLPPPLPQTK